MPWTSTECDREAGGTRRGACPGVHAPFAQVDGTLVRIRLPGGILSIDRSVLLSEILAELMASTMSAPLDSTDVPQRGVLEITSRGNLQIRGLDSEMTSRLTDALVASGMVDPDPDVDGRRNILTGPLAGLDPCELVDTRPLMMAAERILGTSRHVGLSPKFCLVLDGGGAFGVRGRAHDVCLGMVLLRDERHGYECVVGEALPKAGSQMSGDDARVAIVDPLDAESVIEAAVGLGAASEGGRLHPGLDESSRRTLLEAIARRSDVDITWILESEIRRTDVMDGVGPPLGIVAEGRDDTVAIGFQPILGRMAPDVFAQIVDLAERLGVAEVRTTPWHSLLLPGVAYADADSALASLRGLGMVCEGSDPGARVVSCAGSTGCPSGAADTLALGRRLIGRLRAESTSHVATPPTVPTVHLSGCAKCCAGATPFDLTLIAGPTPDSFDLYRSIDSAGPTPNVGGPSAGSRIAEHLDPEQAMEMILEHARMVAS